MPPVIADLAARVTGINPGWLLGDGDIDRPVDVLRGPYTEELWKRYDQPVPITGRIPIQIRNNLWDTSLGMNRTLRAAARKGRYGVAQRFVTLALERCIEDERNEGLGAKAQFLAETDFIYQELRAEYPQDHGRMLAPQILCPDLLYHLDELVTDGTAAERASLLMALEFVSSYVRDLLHSTPYAAEPTSPPSTQLSPSHLTSAKPVLPAGADRPSKSKVKKHRVSTTASAQAATPIAAAAQNEIKAHVERRIQMLNASAAALATPLDCPVTPPSPQPSPTAPPPAESPKRPRRPKAGPVRGKPKK